MPFVTAPINTTAGVFLVAFHFVCGLLLHLILLTKVLRYVLSYLLCCMLLCSVQAQTLQRCKYTVYTRQSGMAEQVVKQMVEDSNGFIWMLSDNVLQWFDGNKFHDIPFGSGPHQLPGFTFYSLIKDSNGRIWVFYDSGFSWYEPGTHSFKHRRFSKTTANFTGGYNVFESPKGIVASNETSALLICKSSGNVSLDHLDTAGQTSVPLRLPSGSFFEMTPHFTKLLHRNYPAHNKASSYVQPVNASTILVFGDQSLSVYHSGNQDVVQETIYPNHKKLITYQHPTAVAWKNEYLLIVLMDEELWEFDTRKMQFTNQLVNLEGKQFFSNGYFKAILFDRQGNLWASSNLDGVFKINLKSKPIQLITSGNPPAFVKCLLVNDKYAKVIVGTYGEGLQVFDTSGHLLKKISIQSAAANSMNIISSMAEVDDDYIILTLFRSDRIYRLNLRDLSLKEMKNSNPDSHFTADYYTTLISGRSGALYYLNQTPIVIDPNTAACTYSIRDFTRDDSIYLQKKTVFNLKNSRVGMFSHNGYFQQCLLNAGMETVPVTSLVRWGNEWLIGTMKGIFLFNARAELLVTYNKAHGLPDENINAILLDKSNRPWCSHNAGISRLSRNGNVLNLGKEDGLQDDEFNMNAAAISANGKLYFGGIKGINCFYPNQLPHSGDVPDFRVTYIAAGEKLLAPDTAFWTITKLRLPYSQNQLKLVFSAIGVNRAAYYNYQYRIAAISKNWIDLHHQTELNLALPPGRYQVEFAVSQQFDPVTTAQKIISLHIVPPFYQRWWFYGLLFLASLSIFWLILRSYNKRRYDKKLSELKIQEELENERQRISRDLHDNIGAYTTALISNVDKLKIRHDDDEPELDKMKENANQIMSSLRETIWVLNNKEISLVDFNDLFKNYCLKVLQNYEQVSFRPEEQILNSNILPAATALHLHKILQEALQNSLKHSAATRIEYKIIDTGNIKVLLNDNGAGFDTSAASTGNGLDNIRWRAEQAGFNLEVKSTIGIGTSVRVTNILKK